MSWNWDDVRKENEERIDYNVQGTVTISTQEYRDLLDRITELKIAGQKEHDDWYSVYKERDSCKEELNKLKEDNIALSEEIKQFKSWLSQNDELALKFFTYKENINHKEETE